LRGHPQPAACSRLTSGLNSPALKVWSCLPLWRRSYPWKAFSSATESRFHMLESQLLMEKLRLEREDAQAAKKELMEEQQVTQSKAHKEDFWTKQLAWEKEQYVREEAREKSKEEKEEHLRSEKKNMLIQLLEQGKTVTKAESLMRLVFS
ncbi:hypothetical protein VP01_9941g1, partial [Puccinia sorghi]